jgi:outer membrane biosynthesis protein TonB
MVPSRLFSPAALSRFVVLFVFAGLLPISGPAARAQSADPQQPSAPAATAQETPAAAAQQPAPAAAEHPAAPETPAATTQQAPAPAEPPATPSPAPQPAASAAKPQPAETGITEEEIKRQVAGKDLFLRGGYLDNSLNFNEHGKLISSSPVGSYTLSAIRIDKVRLSKHKVELDGQRYGLHFLGELPYEDPTKAVDRVQITPKKKFVRITIDRELIVKPKKTKEKEKDKIQDKDRIPGGKIISRPATPAPAATTAQNPPAATPAAAPQPSAAPAATSAPAPQSASAPAAAPESAATAPAQPAGKDSDEAQAEAEAKAEMAAAPPEERPADPKSVTTTLSPAHATKLLKEALDNIFAQGFDDRMMNSMPDFWKLYYAAAAAKTDYRPKNPVVLRQSQVDKKARLVSAIDPPSNQFAQDSGVAGMCLYHVVVGPDGKPQEIAVARPIGFGLDESAVNSIRKAKFEPAIKDGQPVPVLLDLIVEFRIYSKLTNAVSKEPHNPSAEPTLPGPYSVEH